MLYIDDEIKLIETFVFISTAIILLVVILFIFFLIETKRQIYLEDTTINLLKSKCQPRLNKLSAELTQFTIQINEVKELLAKNNEKSEET